MGLSADIRINAQELQAMEESRPAGVYEVTSEEQQISDFMFEAFRRISTTIYLPPRANDFWHGRNNSGQSTRTH